LLGGVEILDFRLQVNMTEMQVVWAAHGFIGVGWSCITTIPVSILIELACPYLLSLLQPHQRTIWGAITAAVTKSCYHIYHTELSTSSSAPICPHLHWIFQYIPITTGIYFTLVTILRINTHTPIRTQVQPPTGRPLQEQLSYIPEALPCRITVRSVGLISTTNRPDLLQYCMPTHVFYFYFLLASAVVCCGSWSLNAWPMHKPLSNFTPTLQICVFRFLVLCLTQPPTSPLSHVSLIMQGDGGSTFELGWEVTGFEYQCQCWGLCK
jgi:hypothetical protein